MVWGVIFVVRSRCSCLVINTNLFNTAFTCHTHRRKGGYLIVSGHPRLKKGVCYRGVRKVGMRYCNTRVFRASSGEV